MKFIKLLNKFLLQYRYKSASDMRMGSRKQLEARAGPSGVYESEPSGDELKIGGWWFMVVCGGL